MTGRKLALEGKNCTRMHNGNVIISPNRGRGILLILLGLPLFLFSLWMFISEPGELFIKLLSLSFGGALLYVGFHAMVDPEISIEVTNRLIHVRSRGSQAAQTWPFEALKDVGGKLLNVTTTGIGDISLIRTSLRLDDGRSLLLFTTADRRKAQRVISWLEAAFARTGVEDTTDSEV
jgi:hypothetical protein